MSRLRLGGLEWRSEGGGELEGDGGYLPIMPMVM